MHIKDEKSLRFAGFEFSGAGVSYLSRLVYYKGYRTNQSFMPSDAHHLSIQWFTDIVLPAILRLYPDGETLKTELLEKGDWDTIVKIVEPLLNGEFKEELLAFSLGTKSNIGGYTDINSWLDVAPYYIYKNGSMVLYDGFEVLDLSFPVIACNRFLKLAYDVLSLEKGNLNVKAVFEEIPVLSLFNYGDLTFPLDKTNGVSLEVRLVKDGSLQKAYELELNPVYSCFLSDFGLPLVARWILPEVLKTKGILNNGLDSKLRFGVMSFNEFDYPFLQGLGLTDREVESVVVSSYDEYIFDDIANDIKANYTENRYLPVLEEIKVDGNRLSLTVVLTHPDDILHDIIGYSMLGVV